MLALPFLLMRWRCGWDLLYCPSVSIDACSQTRVSAHSHAVLFHTLLVHTPHSETSQSTETTNQYYFLSQCCSRRQRHSGVSLIHTQRDRDREVKEKERDTDRDRDRDLREREREREREKQRETERENVLKPVKGCHYSVTVSHHQCFNGVYKNYNHLHQMTI